MVRKWFPTVLYLNGRTVVLYHNSKRVLFICDSYYRRDLYPYSFCDLLSMSRRPCFVVQISRVGSLIIAVFSNFILNLGFSVRFRCFLKVFKADFGFLSKGLFIIYLWVK